MNRAVVTNQGSFWQKSLRLPLEAFDFGTARPGSVDDVVGLYERLRGEGVYHPDTTFEAWEGRVAARMPHLLVIPFASRAAERRVEGAMERLFGLQPHFDAYVAGNYGVEDGRPYYLDLEIFPRS